MALSFEEGSIVAQGCHTFINSRYHIHNYYVGIRESRVIRHPDFHQVGPEPREATDSALSAGGNDKDIYLVTARHDVVALGNFGFNDRLAAIDYDIKSQESAITDAQGRIESAEGHQDNLLQFPVNRLVTLRDRPRRR